MLRGVYISKCSEIKHRRAGGRRLSQWNQMRAANKTEERHFDGKLTLFYFSRIYYLNVFWTIRHCGFRVLFLWLPLEEKFPSKIKLQQTTLQRKGKTKFFQVVSKQKEELKTKILFTNNFSFYQIVAAKI